MSNRSMRLSLKKPWLFWYLGLAMLIWGAPASGDDQAGSSGQAKLVRAVMCERIADYIPMQVAVVFSIEVGQISCYTSFDAVAITTYAQHKWYRRDALVTSKRLTLKPPSWSTYSSIQLREADKGPWRVEVYNADNKLIETLRFSVTE